MIILSILRVILAAIASALIEAFIMKHPRIQALGAR